MTKLTAVDFTVVFTYTKSCARANPSSRSCNRVTIRKTVVIEVNRNETLLVLIRRKRR